MGVVIKLRDSRMRVIQCVLICVTVVASACSVTSRGIGTVSTSSVPSPEVQPPTNTVTFVESETTWSVGVDETPTAPDSLLLYLAPPTSIDDATTGATLRRETAGDVPQYDLAVRWPAGLLVLKGSPVVECFYDYTDGSRWRPVEVRDVAGCELEAETGLYSLEWVEGGTRFYYESRDITGREARQMLDDWEARE